MIRIVRRAVAANVDVAVAPIAGLSSVATFVALQAGQWFEPRGRAGVARLAAQTLLRGTQERDARAWSEALDALGAGTRLDVGSHAAFFSGQCLADDLGSYLGLVADAVLRPSFPEAEVEFVRAQALAEFEEDARDTRAVADRTWRELVYPPDHPFRTRSAGDESVVRSTTSAELRAFHRQVVLGGRAIVVVAGGVEPERAFDAVGGALAGWPAAAPVPSPEVPRAYLGAAVRRDVVVPDKTQNDLIVGWIGMPRTDPRFAAARVANMVFAADTFASRIGHVVRDELGLAYYVFSTIGASFGQSPWTLRMGVNPENVERALATARAELGKILAGDIADDDLALAREKLVGELEVSRESAAGVAQQILEAELFGLGEDHHDRYPEMIRAATKDDVLAIVREFLPLDRCATAVAGPPLPR